MAIFKKTFTPKVDKLSFKEVAKKAGLTGLTSKKFQDQAISVLHKSGMAQSAIKGILSGQRKVQPETLKKVFKKLSEGKVIKSSKGSGVVTSYIEEEKARQTKIHNYKMALHKQDLSAERAAEAPKLEQVDKESRITTPQLYSDSVFNSNTKEPNKKFQELNQQTTETASFLPNEPTIFSQPKEENQFKKENGDNQELLKLPDMIID